MQPGQPSRTALGAAAHRAAHQVLEQGSIFADPLAIRILGTDADTLRQRAEADPLRGRMRLFIAVRTRFAEDALATAVARQGVRQLVVLGAGLDTYAYRSPHGDRLRVFEVDHPATQAWKRQRLTEAAIEIPSTLTFAPVDFERENLPDRLAAADFDPALPTFFTWLGVVPYLTEPAIFSTLGYIAGLPGGAQVVFDYGNPPNERGDEPEAGALHRALAARVAAAGEAFQSFFETASLTSRLSALGFGEVQDLGPAAIVGRYFPDARPRAPEERGGHVVRASTMDLRSSARACVCADARCSGPARGADAVATETKVW